MNKPRCKSPNSAIVIARLLSTEGFSPHVANEVKRYMLRNATAEQLRRWKKKKRAMSAFMKNVSDGDKLIVGAFIGALCQMNFNAGLKIGMTAFLHESNGMNQNGQPHVMMT